MHLVKEGKESGGKSNLSAFQMSSHKKKEKKNNTFSYFLALTRVILPLKFLGKPVTFSQARITVCAPCYRGFKVQEIKQLKRINYPKNSIFFFGMSIRSRISSGGAVRD